LRSSLIDTWFTSKSNAFLPGATTVLNGATTQVTLSLANPSSSAIA
jgi:hypothetical protein